MGILSIYILLNPSISPCCHVGWVVSVGDSWSVGLGLCPATGEVFFKVQTGSQIFFLVSENIFSRFVFKNIYILFLNCFRFVLYFNKWNQKHFNGKAILLIEIFQCSIYSIYFCVKIWFPWLTLLNKGQTPFISQDWRFRIQGEYLQKHLEVGLDDMA